MFWNKKNKKTKIIVQYDAGFPNTLYLRGEGVPSLSWERGIPLQNVKPNEWVFETTEPLEGGQFKVVLNDTVYELGDNHTLVKGSSIRINPEFPL